MAKSERELVAEEILYRLSLPDKVIAAIIRSRENTLSATDIRPGTRCYLIDNGYAVETEERKIELTELGTIVYYQLKIVMENKKDGNGK